MVNDGEFAAETGSGFEKGGFIGNHDHGFEGRFEQPANTLTQAMVRIRQQNTAYQSCCIQNRQPVCESGSVALAQCTVTSQFCGRRDEKLPDHVVLPAP